MFYLFKSKESKLKIQLSKMNFVFDNSGMPIDYHKDIAEQFEQVFKDLENFGRPMSKIINGRLADKIESNRILDKYQILLERFYKNYIEDTKCWWTGKPHSGIPLIGPKGELSDILSPNNDLFKAPLVVVARVHVEKLLVQQLESIPQLRKYLDE